MKEKLSLKEFKKCSKCGLEKEIICFGKNLKCKNGINSYCKECKSKKDKQYRIKNKDKISVKKNRVYTVS